MKKLDVVSRFAMAPVSARKLVAPSTVRRRCVAFRAASNTVHDRTRQYIITCLLRWQSDCNVLKQVVDFCISKYIYFTHSLFNLAGKHNKHLIRKKWFYFNAKFLLCKSFFILI